MLGINRRNLDHVFADYRPGRFRELDDKLLAKARLEARGIAVPRTIGVIRSEAQLPELEHWLHEHQELVIKPARGWGGRGILILRRDGERFRTGGGRELSIDRLLDHATDILTGMHSLDEDRDAVLVEERIHPHEFVQELYPRGLSDLRLVLEDGEPLQAMLRVPTDRSDGRANLHGGGLGLGVEIDSGRVTRAVLGDRAVDEHPDTGQPLVGRVVPHWEECIALARRAAAAFSEISYLGVDIVLDRERGPLVLEMNARPGLAIQLANARRQPVRRRSRRSSLESLTFLATWSVLGLLAMGPFLFAQWQQRRPEGVETVRVANRPSFDLAAEDGARREDRAAAQWSDESPTVSEQSETFRLARAAADAGEIERALELYGRAARDSSVAPFALNNLGLLHRDLGNLEQAERELRRATERLPDYARGLYNLGLVTRDQGRIDEAERLFRRVIEIRPSHGRAWGELGELLVSRGAAEEAVQPLRSAIRYEPTLVGYRRALGRAHLQRGRYAQAVEAFERAMALDPDSPTATSGWVRSQLNRAAQAGSMPAPSTLDSMATMLEHFAHEGQTPGLRVLGAEVTWLRRGPLAAREELAALGEIPQALWLDSIAALEAGLWSVTVREGGPPLPGREQLEQIREMAAALEEIQAGSEAAEALEDPSFRDPRLRVLAARLLEVAASPTLIESARALGADNALDAWLDALGQPASELPPPAALAASLPSPLRLRQLTDPQQVPLPASFLLWSARVIAQREGRPVEPWLEALDRRAPGFHPRLRERFTEAVAADFLDTAHELGDRLLEASPADPSTRLRLAGLELRRGETELARRLYEDLDKEQRSTPDARILRARLLLAEDRLREATEALGDILDDDPLEVEALVLQGEALFRRGREEDAARHLRRALDEQPKRLDIRDQLARQLMDRRRYEEAESEWRRALALAPDSTARRSPLFNLALCQQRTERLEEAVATWSELATLDPDNYKVYFNRGLALEDLGRLNAAVEDFETALALRPDHRASQEKLRRLRDSGDPP